MGLSWVAYKSKLIGKVHKHVGKVPTYRCMGQGCEAVEQSEFLRVNVFLSETLRA